MDCSQEMLGRAHGGARVLLESYVALHHQHAAAMTDMAALLEAGAVKNAENCRTVEALLAMVCPPCL